MTYSERKVRNLSLYWGQKIEDNSKAKATQKQYDFEKYKIVYFVPLNYEQETIKPC